MMRRFRGWALIPIVALSLIGLATLRIGSTTAAPLKLTPTPAPTIVWPALTELQPGQATPGQGVTVIGHGGYLLGPNGEYDESSRDFELYFDGRPVGSITCSVNYCQGVITVPADVTGEIHHISTEGGSSIELTLLSEAPTATPTPEMRREAALILHPAATTLIVSDTLTVTITKNDGGGCPYSTYDLTLNQSEEQVFAYRSPQKIGPGVSYPAVFTLTAVTTGTVTLEATAYGEYYCNGSWTWAYVYGQSAPITVQGTTPPTPVPLPGDVNGDGTVDIFDLATIAVHYGEANSEVDLNGDGQIDIFDLSIVASNFGK